ncbi:unnamed protein product, partial [Candidula unifasciata]
RPHHNQRHPKQICTPSGSDTHLQEYTQKDQRVQPHLCTAHSDSESSDSSPA